MSEPTPIPLPEPRLRGPLSVEEAIHKRRSVRSFADARLASDVLSQLFWAAQGVTEASGEFRAAPSAGATFPLETYGVTAGGVFRYRPGLHALEQVREGDARPALAEAALRQDWIARAALIVVLAGAAERTTRRYGHRGQAFVYMEAGHAAQNLHLQAVAIGLGSVGIGAFDDDRVAAVLGLPDGVRPLYLIPIGPRAERNRP